MNPRCPDCRCPILGGFCRCPGMPLRPFDFHSPPLPFPSNSIPQPGELGGPCNRRACRAPDARWYNQSTRAHYCERCARELNQANEADAQRLFGGPLCLEVT